MKVVVEQVGIESVVPEINQMLKQAVMLREINVQVDNLDLEDMVMRQDGIHHHEEKAAMQNIVIPLQMHVRN